MVPEWFDEMVFQTKQKRKRVTAANGRGAAVEGAAAAQNEEGGVVGQQVELPGCSEGQLEARRGRCGCGGKQQTGREVWGARGERAGCGVDVRPSTRVFSNVEKTRGNGSCRRVFESCCCALWVSEEGTDRWWGGEGAETAGRTGREEGVLWVRQAGNNV